MRIDNRVQIQANLRQKIILILFGLVLLVIMLEVTLRLGGFIFLSMQEYRNLSSLKQKGTYRIVCIGESTTANIYPVLLEKILNQRNAGIRFSVINKGVPGINTSAILEKLESNIDSYQPDMVIAMIGLNDAGKHIPYASIGNSNNKKFFNSLKVYKLICLLWAHATNKMHELRIRNKNSNDAPSPIARPFSNTSVPSEKNVQAQYDNTEADALKDAIVMNPSDDHAYDALGQFYITRYKFSEAERLFKRALELNPGNPWYYSNLGFIYTRYNKMDLAEEMFKKAIESDPKNATTYFELGLYVYKIRGDLLRLEEVLRNAIALNPGFCWAYIELAHCYQKQNKFAEAVEVLNKAIKIDPDNTDRYYGALASLNMITNDRKDVQRYYDKVKQLRFENYNPVTRNNYLRFIEILDRRKVRFVCMQYPVRSIEPLKVIFQNQAGIIFVDNERIFKEAMAKGSYEEYFRDMIGGDFGHCTEKGNRLLAENIANVILKEVFGK
ncbi:MAG: tetratricopeptide repeat protein [Candidatus Omnitrophota bacterium]